MRTMETPNRFLESANGLLERINRSPYTYALIAALIGVNVGRVLNTPNFEAQKAAFECEPCPKPKERLIKDAKIEIANLVNRLSTECEKDSSIEACESIDNAKRALDVVLSHTDYQCAQADVALQPAPWSGSGPVSILAITESTYKPEEGSSAQVCIYPEAFRRNDLSFTVFREALNNLNGDSNVVPVAEDKITSQFLAGPDASSK